MNLTTLSQVKAILELTETDWDGLLEELIAAVSQRAGTYCNRDFEKKERVEYHDGGGRYLYLKGLPVVEIASIYGSDSWEWDGGSLVPADHYQLLNAGMVASRFGTWPYGPKALKVVYSGGYAEDEVPADLEMAARTQSAYDFKRRKDIGLESVSFPDGSIQKVSSGEFLSMVKQVLDRYRIRPHG
ncbi:MAG: phage head-tail connector protein [Deltaproteobacteria bacterium]|nr:phage head-tail connector protein [Deltaproteobacteria bacterium]